MSLSTLSLVAGLIYYITYSLWDATAEGWEHDTLSPSTLSLARHASRGPEILQLPYTDVTPRRSKMGTQHFLLLGLSTGHPAERVHVSSMMKIH